MPNFFNIKLNTLKWILPILILYVVGGGAQYLGLLSQTQSSFIVLFLFLHVFHFYSSWSKIRLETFLFIFLVFIIINHFFINSLISYTATYVYYILCTIISAVSGRVYCDHFFNKYEIISNQVFFKIAKIFLVLQLVVTIIQATFTEAYISFSNAAIGYEDAIFGTLFLQSDATLATICELMILCVYLLPSKIRDKIIITTLSLAVIFLGNSKTAQIVLLLILLIIFLKLILNESKGHKLGFKLLILLSILFLIFFTYSMWSDLINSFIQEARYDYQRKDEWVTAPRFAPLGEIFERGITLFGNGPLTYYNPIDKTWLYNSGFSTIYILYFDYGLLGLFLYLFYQIYLIVKFGINFSAKLLLGIVLISYINFNFVLTDIGFIFMFNFALLFMYRYDRIKKTLPEISHVGKM